MMNYCDYIAVIDGMTLLQIASKSEHNAWLSQLIQGTLYASKNLGTLHVPCR